MTQRYVGQAMKRKEDPRLVSGTSTYVDDVVLPGMVYMAVTRSIHAHARIRHIDTSKAQKLPGVVAVAAGTWRRCRPARASTRHRAPSRGAWAA